MLNSALLLQLLFNHAKGAHFAAWEQVGAIVEALREGLTMLFTELARV